MCPVKSCLTCSQRQGPLPMTQPESTTHRPIPTTRRILLISSSSIFSSLRRAPRLAYPNNGCRCDRAGSLGFTALENVEATAPQQRRPSLERTKIPGRGIVEVAAEPQPAPFSPAVLIGLLTASGNGMQRLNDQIPRIGEIPRQRRQERVHGLPSQQGEIAHGGIERTGAPLPIRDRRVVLNVKRQAAEDGIARNRGRRRRLSGCGGLRDQRRYDIDAGYAHAKCA